MRQRAAFCVLVMSLLALSPVSGQAAPKVYLRTLDGQSIAGGLLTLDEQRVQIAEADAKPPRQVALDDVLSLELSAAAASEREAPQFWVMTTDGSVLSASGFVTDGKVAKIQPALTAELSLPIQSIASVLRAKNEQADVKAWLPRARMARTRDVLELHKEGKRHELEGIIANVNGEGLLFRIDGQEVPVRLERVTAIYFAHKDVESDALADIVDSSGSSWAAQSLSLAAEVLTAKTPAGLELQLPLKELQRISFARGRIVHLSDLEPSLVQHTPFFDTSWDYQRDRSFAGGALRIAGATFLKGLALHSRTVLEYDLKGEYRRFETSIGIDDSAGPLGDATVRISADGKPLWEGRVIAGEPARPLVLPIAKTQALVLEVDFGDQLDLGDHVVFGDAKVIK